MRFLKFSFAIAAILGLAMIATPTFADGLAPVNPTLYSTNAPAAAIQAEAALAAQQTYTAYIDFVMSYYPGIDYATAVSLVYDWFGVLPPSTTTTVSPTVPPTPPSP